MDVMAGIKSHAIACVYVKDSVFIWQFGSETEADPNMTS